MESIFYITYEDGTIYEGGNTYEKMNWIASFKNKKIKSIIHRIPNSNDAIILSNYDRYYSQVEVTQDVNGDRAGIVNLEYVYMMGQIGDKVICYQMSIKSCDIRIYTIDANSDSIKQLNPDFWR